jgi:hypothetical protein
MRLLAIALGLWVALLAGCTEPQAHAATPAATPAAGEKADPVTKLPCFECHDAKRWVDGPGFPHNENHEDVGHCHVCHVGMGHKGTSINTEVCKSCHDEVPKY